MQQGKLATLTSNRTHTQQPQNPFHLTVLYKTHTVYLQAHTRTHTHTHTQLFSPLYTRSHSHFITVRSYISHLPSSHSAVIVLCTVFGGWDFQTLG